MNKQTMAAVKKPPQLNDEIYDRQAEICSALASPVRLKILDILGDSEKTATTLQEILDLPKSNLSQHLAVLKRAGIIRTRSEGRSQYLSLSIPEVKKACGLVKQVLIAQMNQQAAMAKALQKF